MDEEHLLRLMVDQAADHALILLDPNGTVIAWRMASTKTFGYEPAEIVGGTIERLFTEEDRQGKVPANELELAARYGTAEDDRWMVRKDGLRLWASGVVTCLRNAEGKIAGFSKLLRDRTDTRGQVEALRNRADALAEEDRRKTLVLGTLAHELRNPLGVLANAVQLIDLAHPHDPKLSYATQLIGRQAKFLSTLIEDLLEVVRIRAGKAGLQVRQLGLRELIDDALESVGTAIRGKAQRVEVVLPPVPITLEVDPTRVKQVLINLVSNASRFSDAGATVWIKGTTEGDEAVVRVTDQGRGIAPNLLPHVFEMFSQANAAPRDDGPGLGLGLSIVKEYVELHGGSVQVRSEGAGQGSEFVIRLPLRQKASG